LLILTVSQGASIASAQGGEHNKQVVLEFYDLAMNQHRPQAAANQFIGSVYTQHNPLIADGKKAFADFLEARIAQFPELHSEIKSIFSDGNRVILHVRSKTDQNDRGRAIVDIFRLEDGKIVEHWDVIQPIPEKSANPNGMF
jgi:predicted SnoaL-like aldol condensation-catalyzing enzyme